VFAATRGGVVARKALLLALLSINLGLAGCQRKAAQPPRHYVRLEALLPLHPIWEQVARLESLAQATRQSAQQQAASLRLEASPLPVSFPAPVAVPPSLEQERRARIAEDARRRIQGLAEELRRRNAELLRREEAAGARQLENQVAAARTELEGALLARQANIRTEYEGKLNPLRFKSVIFETQVRGFSGQPQQDAQAQLNAINAEVARLEQERDTRLAEAQEQMQRDLAARKQELTRQYNARLAQRRAELETLAARQVQREEASLSAQSEPIPPLGSASLGTLPPTVPLPPPASPDTVAPAAFAQAQGQVAAAGSRQRAEVEAQKAHFVALIREDTRQAVLAISHRQGWVLVPQGTPGASDWTQAVAGELRAQWQLTVAGH